MHYTIDRFEDGNWAVLENPEGQTFNVPISWLPEAVVEGDVLYVKIDPDNQQSEITFLVDEAEGQRRLEQAKLFRERLPKGSEGDLKL